MFKTVYLSKKALLLKFLKGLIIGFLIVKSFILLQKGQSGAEFGVNFCLNTLVPSMFPFMVLSVLIVKLGLNRILVPILEPITKALFKLPGISGATIFLGLLGGYPAGASGIISLLENKEITKKQAERMSYFVVGAGPGFIVNVIGEQLLQNKKIGIIVLLAQIISAILLGFLLSFVIKDKTKEISKINNHKKVNFSDALIQSVKMASDNIINMCFFVVLFSSVLEIISTGQINVIVNQICKCCGLNSNVLQLISPVLLEVTNAVIYLTKNHISIYWLLFALSWGGICVHFQIFYCLRNLNISKFKFMLFRFLHAALAGVVFYVMNLFFYKVAPTSCIKIYSVSNSFFAVAPSSLALILLCIFFLATLTPSKVFFCIDKKGK